MIKSPYAVVFDSSSKYWEQDVEYNRAFLKCQQNYVNDRLRHRVSYGGLGYVFLNEVYRCLDLPDTKIGNVMGWFYHIEEFDDLLSEDKIRFNIRKVRNKNEFAINFDDEIRAWKELFR